MPWPSGPVVVSTPLVSKFSGCPGVLRAELPEIPDLVERHVGVAGEVQQRIEQHRAVPGRQHKAVAVRPFRIGGVEFQELGEQDGGDVGGAHRQAGMAGLGLLDGVHGKATDRVGHTGMIDLRHDEFPPEMRCLEAIRSLRECRGWWPEGNGKSGLDSTSVPRVQGSETRCGREKLLSSA